MKTRPFREYIPGPSMTTLETRRNMQLMQTFSGNNRNRKRHTCSDILCKCASIILYTGCAVSIVMLIATMINP